MITLIKHSGLLISALLSLAGYSKLASVPAGGTVAVAASGAPGAGGAAASTG